MPDEEQNENQEEETEQEAPEEPVAEAEAPAAEPQLDEPSARDNGFTPPPSSLEDLAAASRPTKFNSGRR
jgi:hypothetical protein